MSVHIQYFTFFFYTVTSNFSSTFYHLKHIDENRLIEHLKNTSLMELLGHGMQHDFDES